MRKWLFVFFVTFFCIFSVAVWAQESRVNRILMTKLAGKGLLLLFDEYELIESKIDEGVLRPNIATFFASLLEAHPRLSLIFTGSQNLEGRNVEYWRILTGKSLYRRISFLSERDALCLYYRASGGPCDIPAGHPGPNHPSHSRTAVLYPDGMSKYDG